MKKAFFGLEMLAPLTLSHTKLSQVGPISNKYTFEKITLNLFKTLVSFENLKKSLKKLNSFHLKITITLVFLQLKLFKFLS